MFLIFHCNIFLLNEDEFFKYGPHFSFSLLFHIVLPYYKLFFNVDLIPLQKIYSNKLIQCSPFSTIFLNFNLKLKCVIIILIIITNGLYLNFFYMHLKARFSQT